MIQEHAGKLSIKRACGLMRVRRQGYYEWDRRRSWNRSGEEEAFKVKVVNIFFESGRIYGARKILAILARQGIFSSRKRIRRIMLEEGLVPLTYRRHVVTTDSHYSLNIYPDLLKQNFHIFAANKVWVSDITYVRTGEGWLYLCSVIDLFSRRPVGWAVSSHIDRHLAIAAFTKAIKNRAPGSGLIFHSDRGCQYASGDFRRAALAVGSFQSMSRAGCPYDNACAETFFKSIKMECLDNQCFNTRAEAEAEIARYMLFYTHKRIHQTLDYLSPAEYERCHPAQLAVS